MLSLPVYAFIRACWPDGFFDSLLLEETEQGLLLRKKNDNKLSWKQTYKAMADEPEDWSDLDEIVMDGLGEEDIADQEI